MPEKKCLVCGKKIHGRADKVFCSPKCRTKHNYYYNPKKQIIIINKVLRKNRQILKKRIDLEVCYIPKNVAIKEGFNFKYFTNMEDDYIFCYEYGYKIIVDKENNETLKVIELVI